MAGTPIQIHGHTVYVWEKTISIDGCIIHINRKKPKEVAEQLRNALEKYRKIENGYRLNHFIEENMV